jgi:tight adherence protein B
MVPVSPAGAVAGGLIVAGLLLVVHGLLGAPRPPRDTPRWARTRPRIDPRRLLAALAGAGVMLVLTGWPVAALATAAATVVLPELLRPRGAQQVIARLDALAGWSRRLADVLASGAGGLEQAIAASVGTCPRPIAPQVSALAARARTTGVEAALCRFADDVADPVADRIAASLILRAKSGGPGLQTVLDNLADAITAEVTSRQQVEADRARPRSNVRTIVILTAGVSAAMILFARGYLAPFDDAAGQAVLALIAAIFGGGFWWMHLIARPRVGARFLSDSDGVTATRADAAPGTGRSR